jgi:flagellar protein FlbD
MILLTRLDRQELALNSDLIESIDARPDTTIRMVTGQFLVVRESVAEVLARILAWRASIVERAGVVTLATSSLTPVVLPPFEEAREEVESAI